MPRLITIVMEIDQPQANWLWEVHRTGAPQNGITNILIMANGNKITELEKLLDIDEE